MWAKTAAKWVLGLALVIASWTAIVVVPTVGLWMLDRIQGWNILVLFLSAMLLDSLARPVLDRIEASVAVVSRQNRSWRRAHFRDWVRTRPILRRILLPPVSAIAAGLALWTVFGWELVRAYRRNSAIFFHPSIIFTIYGLLVVVVLVIWNIRTREGNFESAAK